MERPLLTDVLSSVLSAAMENPHRPSLLATVQTQLNEGRSSAGNVIPLPRRSAESRSEELSEHRSQDAQDHEPTPAA